MRRLLALLAFFLLFFSLVVAQGNGCGNGNGNNGYGNSGNGNSYGYNGNGNSAWGSNWPQWVVTWLENGGQVPMPLAVAAIHEARSWGQQTLGLNQGQMIVKYLQGQLTVEYVSTAPPTLSFRLSSGGSGIVVVIDTI